MSRMRIVWLVAVGVALCVALGVAGSKYVGNSKASKTASAAKFAPGDEELGAIDSYWNQRLTYPTGRFNPAWLRNAARQAAHLPTRAPTGGATWTPLGPQPERMHGCSGCYDYGEHRGPCQRDRGRPDHDDERLDRGVRRERRRRRLEDDELLLGLDVVDGHDRRPAHLRRSTSTRWRSTRTTTTRSMPAPVTSTSAPSRWAARASSSRPTPAPTGPCSAPTFSAPAYTEPAGQFPQYDAVGKVRVDPNNSNNVVAGTKKGIYVSYNGGTELDRPLHVSGSTTSART